MAPARLLWLGPYAADLVGRAVETYGSEPDRLWLVPTPLARDGLVAALARGRDSHQRPRVFCWDDLWLEVARVHSRPPAILPQAAAREAIVAAIERARSARSLGVLEGVADLPGFRRDLRSRFDAWTRAERRAPRDDEVEAAAWSIFRRYRSILAEHFAEDAAGLAVWASQSVAAGALGKPMGITILDPVAPSRAQERVIDWATRSIESVLVTFPRPDGPDDMAVAPLYDWLIEAEFLEEEFEPPTTGLGSLEAGLFDDDYPLDDAPGLTILGGPKGEGLGLLMAREVAARIEAGVPPDEIQILFPSWDDDASRALEILRSWGLPVTGIAPLPLASLPAVAALRLAVSVVVGSWESGPLIRLLRNGQLAPRWADAEARAEAASTIQSLRVFRGLDSIGLALDRPDLEQVKEARAGRARQILDRLAKSLSDLPARASWTEHVDALHKLARALGLGGTARDGGELGPLWEALDDHTLIRDGAEDRLDRGEFAATLDEISLEIREPAAPLRPGCAVFSTVADAQGSRARVILLTNLAEGTFPSRASVSAAGREEDVEALPLAYSRERLAFLRVIGSARDEAVLLVPTTDEKGQDLLAAGFVEDVRRRLGTSLVETSVARIDPLFRGHADLARSPADARIHAVARACGDRDLATLRAIARDTGQRRALEGTAAGLRLIHERWRVKKFTQYDGLFADPRLVARIAEGLGPRHVFSPSQFESFALCPFQFFQKFVLKLTPVEDLPELRINFASRGDRLHGLLEEIHAAVASEGPDVELLERIEAFIVHQTSIAFDEVDDEPGDVAGGLRAIEDEDIRLTLGRYKRQFRSYYDKMGAEARPTAFEWKFGLESAEREVPALELGEGESSVRLRGSVDRIDRIRTKDGDAFRVIDYKTGHAPSGSEVTKHLRFMQLPLYALAAERLLFNESPPAGCDFGYWALGKDGYQHVQLKGENWADFRERVVDEVLRLAALMRRGVFAVDPKTKDCRRMCDYKTVCRIGQISRVGKILVNIGGK
jgi:ATP-dependent helicase/nuclease subunit B